MLHAPGQQRILPRRAVAVAARGGFMLTELLIAATVLIAVLSTVAKLTVTTGRLRMETRRSAAALDELSNQLDRLVALDETARAEQINNLTPSPALSELMPTANLTAEELDDDDGPRLVVRLTWGPPERPSRLALVGWLDDRADAPRSGQKDRGP